jgi:hypothetical protein
MKNPFYGLTVIAGVAFALTACAYFVMALRGAKPELAATSHGLIAVLEQHGLSILAGELAVLAVATFGAIGLDDYGARRTKRARQEQSDESASLRRS